MINISEAQKREIVRQHMAGLGKIGGRIGGASRSAKKRRAAKANGFQPKLSS